MHYKNRYEVSRKDVYQKVTDYVIEALEKGQIPWRQKWSASGLPRNITSNRNYRGWNVFYLNFITLRKQYKTPYFLTFKQAMALGGHIRKGERGYPITYWAKVERRSMMEAVVDDISGTEPEKPRTRLVPRMHTVFNIEQTEGISHALTEQKTKTPVEKIAVCENIIAAMPHPPGIIHNGSNPVYYVNTDTITMPLMCDFTNEEEYYTTLFHELGHSTGHRTRLNRKELVENTKRGGETYAKEELTAEFTAAFLAAVAGIEQVTIDNSAAYIQTWLKRLKNDKTLILRASTQAQAAADYILHVPAAQAADTPEAAADAA